MTSNWAIFEQGVTLGQKGSEHGIILRDEEYEGAARITLEQASPIAPFTVTCGIYGWTFHTRLFSTLADAEAAYSQMQEAISAIVALIPYKDDPELDLKQQQAIRAISQFLERFP